ncbi:MAG: branched-chain amino acid ABC transporter permease [Bacillota bacterium]|nr:branched-chain amino acid ABC transporter permease [Bacillota bacterium]
MYQYLSGILSIISINVTAVCGLAILTGFTGMFSLGHAGFMSIGAYASAILMLNWNVPFIPSMLFGGFVAALVSLIVGYPTMKGKMRGDCFAIAMMGFSEAVRLGLSNIYPLINGALGLSGIPKYSEAWVVLLIAAICVWLTYNYSKSKHGRIALSVRDEETAAELIGVNVVREKIKSFMISAFFCGMAGCMYACYYTFITPNTFSITTSNNLLAMVVLGGMGSVTGPTLAAAFLAMMPEMLRIVQKWRLVIYGLIIILVMLFKPEGLMGGKEFSLKGLVGLFKHKKAKAIAGETREVTK